MSGQINRQSNDADIDRNQPLTFTFDGRRYQGYRGDTLASALLANDVHLVARSFKYHRPRGIYSAGSEEPCALVTVGSGKRAEPNTRATMVELYDGLVASSQNAWPSIRFDVGAINNALANVFSAGFYYKTFMWPGLRAWRFYERFIRRAAGMGTSSIQADPDRYERVEAFCDVLVVGTGPSGIAAALSASRSGARVLLIDEYASQRGSQHPELRDWYSSALQELANGEDVTILRRCTAFGYYDGNVVGMIERVSDHLPTAAPGVPRQRHWIVRAAKVILATGSIERPMLFGNNDLPGIMLVNAARQYLEQYAVCAGRRIVIYTNNNSAYSSARLLSRHASVTVVDCRARDESTCRELLGDSGLTLITGTELQRASGRQHVSGVVLSDGRTLSCDLLLSSGGWTPTIHLHSQAGSRPLFSEKLGAFLPGEAREDWIPAGACNGVLNTRECIEQGYAASSVALSGLGFPASAIDVPDCKDDPESEFFACPVPNDKCFVDLQNDVTIADLMQGVSEGYRSAELLKRYTTLGMGTDQGKTANVNALAILAAQRGEPVPAVGVTTFRPPYTPVSIGAIAGRKQRAHVLPTRFTPLHDWHLGQNALMSDSGLWKRPLAYLQKGEDRSAAGKREAAHVRSAVAACDVSTLGKVDIQGPDAAEFLERVYVNRWKSLQPGKARFGVMLREDGFAFDDGTTSCLADGRYLMTTTTGHAEPVLRHLEFLLQVTWPELRVCVSDVTDQWAAIAVAGPRSREMLQSLFGDAVSAAALPFMGVTDVLRDGHLVRIIRVSFSGELGYELYTPANHGHALINAVFDHGANFDIAPYGLDAMDILRIEKGHLTGAEIDGNRTLDDLGLSGMARADSDFIGSVMMRRAGLNSSSRTKLLGFVSIDPNVAIAAGDHFVASERPVEPDVSLGHVSSACFSPQLGAFIALGFLQGGHSRIGSTVYATSPLAGTHVAVKVVSPHFFDAEGARLRA